MPPWLVPRIVCFFDDFFLSSCLKHDVCSILEIADTDRDPFERPAAAFVSEENGIDF